MAEPTSREILARLVAFDTTSRNSNLALLDYVEDYLKRHGVASRRVSRSPEPKANLFATIGPDAAGGIILSGHTDCVAARPLRRPIHIAFSYDEEVGCTGVLDLIADLKGRGFAATCAWWASRPAWSLLRRLCAAEPMK